MDPQPRKRSVVTDHTVGIKNIRDIASKGIITVYDNTSGEKTGNVLCLDMYPKYTLSDKGAETSTKVNPTTLIGDLCSSVYYIDQRLNVIEKQVQDNRKSFVDYQNMEEMLKHMRDHITVLEHNLRSLRETLTYDGEDVPDLETPGCVLENMNV
jgi:hypothetical protein